MSPPLISQGLMACSLPFELLLFFLVALLSLALLLSIARNFLCPVHLCQTRRHAGHGGGKWALVQKHG